jgi:uridine kinase
MSGIPEEGLDGLLARIVAAVRARRPPDGMTTRIVAVDGHGGSGKSSFARHLARALGDAPIVSTDDFASWENPIDWWPELLGRVLVPLSRGEPARFERSRWGGESGGDLVEFAPTEFLILEGVTASREAFAPYLTYSIWIETPLELCLRRGLERDGPDALEQWEAWLAGEHRYVERERPHERADLLVAGDCDLWT